MSSQSPATVRRAGLVASVAGVGGVEAHPGKAAAMARAADRERMGEPMRGMVVQNMRRWTGLCGGVCGTPKLEGRRLFGADATCRVFEGVRLGGCNHFCAE